MVRIVAAQFPARDPGALRPFYTEVLGLPLLDERPGAFGVGVGASRLDFVAAPGPLPAHHFAFNIPRDALPAAKVWLAARATLLTQDGADEFDSASWRSRQIYFRDPAGNILELIAREALPPAADAARFSSGQFIGISEVGLPVGDVPATVAALGREFGLPPYGTGDDSFAPVGDETGLLIVVRAGRHWFPTADAATAAPLAVTLGGVRAGSLTPPGTAHTITMTAGD